MKKKRMIILLLQIGITLASAFLLISYTQKQMSLTGVYVYNKDFVEIGEEVAIEDIKKISVPSSAVTDDFATKEDEIVGKKVDTKAKMGQYIYSNNLVKSDELDPFETMDLSNYRKVSLPIDFINGISGNIKKGDKIDLVYTGENKEKQDAIYSKAFLQNVLVYSINTEDGFKFVDKSDYYPGEATDEIVEPQKLGIITLAVTLEQAEEIEARANAGTVRYITRFKGSEDYETLGYSVNNSDYDKVIKSTPTTPEGAVIGKPVTPVVTPPATIVKPVAPKKEEAIDKKGNTQEKTKEEIDKMIKEKK